MKNYEGHHYSVSDTEIKATGIIETWLADSRPQAIEMALYTHRLHSGNASASPRGVIHCPKCGDIAIVGN